MSVWLRSRIAVELGPDIFRQAYVQDLTSLDRRLTGLIKDLRDLMQDQAHREVRTHSVYTHLLRSVCIQCGQWVFSREDHLTHLETYHPDTKLPWNMFLADGAVGGEPRVPGAMASSDCS